MSEHRRSKRLFASIPIRVRGLDEAGRPFSEDTTTVEISRSGARIGLKNVPRFGTTLEVTNLSIKVTASFLVIHPCPQSYTGLPEWGLASLKPLPNFWGVTFGGSTEDQELIVSALLACTGCGLKQMVKLSRGEYKALGEEARITRPCLTCGTQTPWEVVTREEEEPMPTSSSAAVEEEAKWAGAERRVARRLAVNAPLLITAPSGASELTEIHDLSTKGLKFSSALEFQCGDQIQVKVNFGATDAARAEPCRVMWRQPEEKGSRFLYGVEFLETDWAAEVS